MSTFEVDKVSTCFRLSSAELLIKYLVDVFLGDG